MQYGVEDGTCLALIWFQVKALLNDKSIVPVVQIIYGAFNELLVGIAILPQL